MKLDSLETLYISELKDLYSAENQLVKALPKMANAASSEDLRAAIEEHLEVTREQVERLEQIFGELETSPRGKKCRAMEGLIEEGKEIIEEEGAPAVIDAAIIGAAQRVEHYEMAGYGCVRTYAQLLGYKSAAKLLQKTLDEEADADKKLTELAESVINVEAEEAEGEEDEGDEEKGIVSQVKDAAVTAAGKVGDLVKSATGTMTKTIKGKRSRSPSRR